MMPGPRAGSGVGKYNAESPKQDSKRINSITKTIHFAHLGTILFIYACGLSGSKSNFLEIIFLELTTYV